MPKDKLMLFRCFSDALYFSQSRFMEVKTHLAQFMHKHSHQINGSLKEEDSDKVKLDIVSDMIFL